MDSPSIKQTVCKVLNIFQHGKYLVAYVLKCYINCIDRCGFCGQTHHCDLQKNETILILISFKRYSSHPEKSIVNLSLP